MPAETLKPKLLTFLPCIFVCVRHSHVAIRLAASRCITSMAKSMTTNVMAAVIQNAIPMLGDASSVHARQGSGMLISLLVQGLSVESVPYAPLLVVPPSGLDEGLTRNAEDAQFLEQLLDNSHIDDYKLNTELKVTSRRLVLIPIFISFKI